MNEILARAISLTWLWALIIALWLRHRNKMVSDIVIALSIWYVLQYKMFPDRWFFTWAALGFSPLMAAIYFMLDRRRDIIVFESRLEGEIMTRPDGSQFRVNNTGVSVVRMPYRAYETYEHVGDLRPPFYIWGEGRLIFTDYMDVERRLMYHPEDSRLHNITFSTAYKVWLGLKEKYPEIQNRLVRLTWLRDLDIMEEVEKTFDRTALEALALRAIDREPTDLLGMKGRSDRRRATTEPKAYEEKKTREPGKVERALSGLYNKAMGNEPGGGGE